MFKYKIAHLADIHIRNSTFLDEMQFTFDRLAESLEEQKVDLIIIGGDTFHTKLTVSNEYFDFAINNFRRLSKIAEVVIIPGNHDCALTNPGRLDSISPIVNGVNGDMVYLKHSRNYEPWDYKPNFPNLMFHHFSILDKRDKWPKKENLDPKYINIALYHGSINNSVLDNDWVSVGNIDDISIFDGWDAAFLGDIHVAQFLTPTIAYPGSIRQNNFGETIDKGYILWEIGGKKDIVGRRIILEQKRYFFTLHLANLADLDEVGELPKDCRIRVKLKKEIDLAEEIKIREEIEKRFSPSNEVPFIIPDEAVSHVNITKVGNLDFIHENIRDIEVSKNLIEEYFRLKDVSNDKIEKITELDKKYHSFIDTDVARNKVFEFKKLKWDNFLSYGKDNEIDFDKLTGLVGLIGNNGAGKSSILDTLFFALHNTVFREGATKNGEYVNRKCKRSDVSLDILDEGKTYHIDRNIKKFYSKDEKKEPRVENEVEFCTLPKQKENILNGDIKPDTNKKIREVFGTKEDFEITTYCSQFGLTKFIDARGTERKKSLAKFFDLDVFDIKFEHALEDHKEIKVLIKDLNKETIVKKVSELKKQLEKDEIDYNAQKLMREQLDGLYRQKELEIEELSKEIKSLSFDSEDLTKLNSYLETLEEKLLEAEGKQKEIIALYVESEEKFQLNIEKVMALLAQAEEKSKEIFGIKSKLSILKKKAELVNNIPGVEACKSCVLAKDAYQSKDEVAALSQTLVSLESAFEKIKNAQEHLKLIEKREEISEDVHTLIEDIRQIQKKINHSEENKEVLQRNSEILENIALLKKDRAKLYESLSGVEDVDLIVSIADTKKQILTLEKQLDRAKELSEKNDIYSLYLDAMGKNGISYWIISKKLGYLTKLTNQILSHVVAWKFSIENNEEEKSIRFFISDEKGKRIAELASGGEKTILSLALRAALWKLCLLPKSNILILDESLSFLDDEKFDVIIKLLKYLKAEFFKKIIVITHNQELKKEMDSFIYIEKVKGFSSCKVV